MKKLFFTLAFTALVGLVNAQSIFKNLTLGVTYELYNARKNYSNVQEQARVLAQQNHPELTRLEVYPMPMIPIPAYQPVKLPQVTDFQLYDEIRLESPNRDKTDTKHVLDRFLSYVKIESQSVDDPNPESFPMTEGQRRLPTISLMS